MTIQEIIQYSSFGVGLFGIIVALYQGFERKKLKQFMYSQAWTIFSISQFSFSSAQQTLKVYKEKYKDNIDPDIFELLSKCDAHNMDLFIEAIRQIQLSEPKFDFETISTWKLQGRINEQTASFFIKAMPMKSPSIPFMIWQTLTLKIRKKLTNIVSGNPKSPKATNDDNKPV